MMQALEKLVAEGHVIFDEGYYESAALSYEAAARKVGRILLSSGTPFDAQRLPVLRALALEAHLRVAECCLRRKMGHARAVVHCTRALFIDDECVDAP